MFPTTTAPSLEVWQSEFNGLTTGPGTPYGLKSSDLANMPNPRTGDSDRARQKGQLAGNDIQGGRDVTLTGNVQKDGTSVMHAVRALGRAYASSKFEIPYWTNLPEFGVVGSMCKVRKRNVPLDMDFYVAGVGRVALQLHSTDPRVYGAMQTETSTLTDAGVTAVNAGDTEMRPVVTITGPVTNPTFFDTNGNFSISLTDPNQAGGFTVKEADDFVTIDLDAHTVTYFEHATGITTNVRNWVSVGSWWQSADDDVLVPGSNPIAYESTDISDPGGVLAVMFADAYII